MGTKYKYLPVEYEADKLLKKMIHDKMTKDSDIDWHDRDALNVLEYDRLVCYDWRSEGKVWFVEPLGEEFVKNGGYEKLIAYLRYNHRCKILIITVLIFMCVFFFICANLRIWWPLILFTIIIIATFILLARYEKRKYSNWIKSKIHWHLNKI